MRNTIWKRNRIILGYSIFSVSPTNKIKGCKDIKVWGVCKVVRTKNQGLNLENVAAVLASRTSENSQSRKITIGKIQTTPCPRETPFRDRTFDISWRSPLSALPYPSPLYSASSIQVFLHSWKIKRVTPAFTR